MVSRQLLVCLVVVLMVVAVKEGHARYLPTRSQDDRIDRLRDLIRDVSKQKRPRCLLHTDCGDAVFIHDWTPKGITVYNEVPLLESEVDKYSDNYERPVLYKREVHDMRQVPADFPTK